MANEPIMWMSDVEYCGPSARTCSLTIKLDYKMGKLSLDQQAR